LLLKKFEVKLEFVIAAIEEIRDRAHRTSTQHSGTQPLSPYAFWEEKWNAWWDLDAAAENWLIL
jgi:hypothetical protein